MPSADGLLLLLLVPPQISISVPVHTPTAPLRAGLGAVGMALHRPLASKATGAGVEVGFAGCEVAVVAAVRGGPGRATWIGRCWTSEVPAAIAATPAATPPMTKRRRVTRRRADPASTAAHTDITSGANRSSSVSNCVTVEGSIRRGPYRSVHCWWCRLPVKRPAHGKCVIGLWRSSSPRRAL